MRTLRQAGSTGLTTGQGREEKKDKLNRSSRSSQRKPFDLAQGRENVSRFVQHPAGAGSSKNRETPFREEIEDIDLRCFALMELTYCSLIPRRTVAEFLARVTPNENAATLSLRTSRASVQTLFRISGNQ